MIFINKYLYIRHNYIKYNIYVYIMHFIDFNCKIIYNFHSKGDFMYSKINQIRYELEKLYESQGLTNDVLKLSRELDEKINKLQKEKGNVKK